MRKIEEVMLLAINHGKTYQVDNTRVEHGNVYLHNNKIAIVEKEYVRIFSCGWYTNTTKSRLNAILSSLCGVTIAQKKGIWYIGKDIFVEGMDVKRV